MTFDEWWRTADLGNLDDHDMAKAAWDAAYQHAYDVAFDAGVQSELEHQDEIHMSRD